HCRPIWRIKTNPDPPTPTSPSRRLKTRSLTLASYPPNNHPRPHLPHLLLPCQDITASPSPPTPPTSMATSPNTWALWTRAPPTSVPIDRSSRWMKQKSSLFCPTSVMRPAQAAPPRDGR
ncbi:unnamed protein product, partial [Mycena citricolor]